MRAVDQCQTSNGVVKLILESGISPQDILHRLSEEDVVIEKFEIAVPNLDEIFIHVVEAGDSR